MTLEQKDAIASVLIYQKFHKGEIIVREGDQASSFYFIKSGVLSCVKEPSEEEVSELVAGKKVLRVLIFKGSISEKGLCTGTRSGL